MRKKIQKRTGDQSGNIVATFSKMERAQRSTSMAVALDGPKRGKRYAGTSSIWKTHLQVGLSFSFPKSSQFVFDNTGTSHFDTGCLADPKLPPLPPGVIIKPRRSSAPPSPTSLPPALANITTFYGDVFASAPCSRPRDIIGPAAATPASLQLIRLRKDAGQISHRPHSIRSSASPTEGPVFEIQPSLSSQSENDALRSLPLEVFYNTEILYESRFGATSSTDLSGVDLEERWKIMCFHGLPFLQLLEGIRSRFQPLLS